jgi:hypothetical protein
MHKKNYCYFRNPQIDFYTITDGYVEYSYDGKEFIKGNKFTDGISVIYPEKPLLAVKIVITGQMMVQQLPLMTCK